MNAEELRMWAIELAVRTGLSDPVAIAAHIVEFVRPITPPIRSDRSRKYYVIGAVMTDEQKSLCLELYPTCIPLAEIVRRVNELDGPQIAQKNISSFCAYRRVRRGVTPHTARMDAIRPKKGAKRRNGSAHHSSSPAEQSPS